MDWLKVCSPVVALGDNVLLRSVVLHIDLWAKLLANLIQVLAWYRWLLDASHV
jgi:hypothetical protein